MAGLEKSLGARGAILAGLKSSNRTVMETNRTPLFNAHMESAVPPETDSLFLRSGAETTVFDLDVNVYFIHRFFILKSGLAGN